jgi:hypothetical protein
MPLATDAQCSLHNNNFPPVCALPCISPQAERQIDEEDLKAVT